MRKQKSAFLKVIMIVLLLLCTIGKTVSIGAEEYEKYYDVNFEYNGKKYDVNIKELAENNGITLEEYPYYVVAIEKYVSLVTIFYSKTRIYSNLSGNDNGIFYYNIGSESTFKIDIDGNGKISAYITNTVNWPVKIDKDKYIASNQDIFCGNNIIIKRNHGYEYDSSKEDENKCDEIVRTNKETAVYEKPAVNYNQIGKLLTKSVIKRINKEVNDRNGHIWDKVVLSDGTIGYVFSDNLEKIENFINLEFNYNEKKYNVYMNPLDYGINIEEYPYYVIGEEKNVGLVTIFYSKTRIYSNLSGNDNGIFYHNVGSESTFKIDVYEGGMTNTYITNTVNWPVKIGEDKYIASNQDVFLRK